MKDTNKPELESFDFYGLNKGDIAPDFTQSELRKRISETSSILGVTFNYTEEKNALKMTPADFDEDSFRSLSQVTPLDPVLYILPFLIYVSLPGDLPWSFLYILPYLTFLYITLPHIPVCYPSYICIILLGDPPWSYPIYITHTRSSRHLNQSTHHLTTQQSHTHNLTHTHSHAHTHSHTYTHSLSHTHTLSISRTH